MLGGLILALPFILFQIYGFISTGLVEKEKICIFTAIPFETDGQNEISIRQRSVNSSRVADFAGRIYRLGH